MTIADYCTGLETFRQNPVKNMPSSLFKKHDFIDVVQCQLIDYISAGTQAEVWKASTPLKTEDGIFAVRINYIASGEKGTANWIEWKGRLEKETAIWREFEANPFVVNLRDSSFVPSHETEHGKFDLFIQSMEYLPYGSLDEYLTTEQRKHLFELIGQDQKIPAFLRLLVSAVKEGHEAGRIHGDIKPSNILLNVSAGNYPSPKLMDFGLSMDASLGFSGGFIGTPEYSPIAFLTGDIGATTKTDIYALGAVFYEFLTGKKFVEGTDNLKPDERKNAVVGALRARREFDISEIDQDVTLSQRRRDQLVTLTNLMLESTSPKGDGSMTLAFVVQNLAHCETQDTQEPKNTVRPRTYRWAKSVHEALDETPVYFVVKSEQPYDDEEVIRKNLAMSGIRGYSLYRLVGTHDFMLRIWRSNRNERLIDRAIDKYIHPNRFSARVSKIDIRKYVTFSDKKTEFAKTKQQVLLEVAQSRDRDSQVEFSRLKRLGLVNSRIADDRSGKTAIRVFLFVLTNRENLSDEAWDTFHEKCDHIVKGHASLRDSAIKNVSSYQCKVTDLGDQDTQIGVMYRMIVNDYHRYTDLLKKISDGKHILEQHAKRQILTTSLFELDKKGMIESDDGEILFQAEQFG
ncbi:MAG: protein kinase [Pseudomonadota bacterium]